MNRLDPDQPDARVVAELAGLYKATATRVRRHVISPRGNTAGAQAWNQARAAQTLLQINQEISLLTGEATRWTSSAVRDAVERGIQTAEQQANESGVADATNPVQGSFSLVDTRTVEVLARDTVRDLTGAAQSMSRQADRALRRMAATGVTNAEVNTILSTGVIEGKPRQAIRELREALRAVHGDRLTIIDKNGQPREFAVGHYARVVAITKTRQAAGIARHERLASLGIDLVVVVGSNSVNFCTAYVGKVFSISGRSRKYPPLSALPGGGPPFHPNCSKGTAPFVEDLADAEDLEEARLDADTNKLLRVKDRSELQRRYEALGRPGYKPSKRGRSKA